MALDTAARIAIVRGLTARFDNAVIATTPFYSNLCTTFNSTGADEEYGMLGAVPQVREWLKDREFETLRGANYEIINKLWESSILVRKVDFDDDRLALYPSKFTDLGVRAARHPDKLLLGDFIPNAESRLCYDGQNFFDTDHAWGDSGTQSNMITQTVVNADAPTVTEFKKALNDALHRMLEFKDDFGELIHDDAVIGMAGGMTLVCYVPLKYRQVAIEATTTGITINQGATNVVITDAQVVASAYVTANQMDLYRTDTTFRPYIFQAREPLSRQSKNLNDIEFKDIKFMTQTRYNMGYGNWAAAVRTKFST